MKAGFQKRTTLSNFFRKTHSTSAVWFYNNTYLITLDGFHKSTYKKIYQDTYRYLKYFDIVRILTFIVF